jgi:predicted acylesterase/phospholipase RssA
MSALDEADRIASGGAVQFQQLKPLADGLRDAGHAAAVGPLLSAVARRALYDGWEPARRAELAALLRDHQQFGYARRLLRRVRADGPDSEQLRQQHALCTYKDAELPAARRLDRALAILTDDDRAPLERSDSAETLGIAGAIYKRRWEVDAKRADLESALWCYRRGAELGDQEEWSYAAVNAAFVADRLAALEDKSLGGAAVAAELRADADRIRTELVARVQGGDGGWHDATRGEALFGLGHVEEAREPLARVGERTRELWRQESTAMQLAELARLRGFKGAEVDAALGALVGGFEGAVRRAYHGKIGIALSGGGFRASLFHLGVLARLAECGVLRHVEALSCVSGGSIVGACYYLALRRLLEERPDDQIEDAEYVELVHRLSRDFLDGVRGDLRGRLADNVVDNWRMLASRWSRTDRVAELLHELFFSRWAQDPGRDWRLDELVVRPHGQASFSLRYENWLRCAKVPVLVLNATTLNTGHNWQFSATWMGEPPTGLDLRVEAIRRLRRVYYRDAPGGAPTLERAVAASACVPGLFAPVPFGGIYDPEVDVEVELVDGGVHDNQGIASLLEQDCNVILVSDASGQAADVERPKRALLNVLLRTNSVLMSRVRGAQYADLASRRRSETLRGLMIVHLKKGLPAQPRDWKGTREPWDPEDDALPEQDRTGRSPYPIDEDVQRALAQLRTDLDAFSDEEAYALMGAGYQMTACDLQEALPELARARRSPSSPWPFAELLPRLEHDPDRRLWRALEPGRSLFFRRIGSWWRRRRRKPSSATSRGVRAVRTVVVAPVRAVVSAPLALIGGAVAGVGERVRRLLRGRRR